MINLDYPKLASTPVAADPFPHVVVPDFVPPGSLRAVVADLPPLGNRGSFPPDSLRMGPNARELMAEMEGPRLRGAIMKGGVGHACLLVVWFHAFRSCISAVD